MRSLCALFGLGLLAMIGCGSDAATTPDMATLEDLSASTVFDISTANDDMTGLTGCRGLAACLTTCKGSPSCQMTCRMGATTTAKKIYKTLTDCRLGTCFAHPDGGAEPCVVGMAASAMCMTCLKDADTPAGTCAAGGIPSWCGACYQDFAACQADLP